ncbi:MAG TPA: hypothetical protein VJ440_08280 [Candidatus Brocadiaceae bacterium]|nr:hypothetical protein [Candidatus Brocadiaceae bacterium]
MKVLLDECVTRYLKRDFIGHEVLTVEEAGYKGLKNGQLLQAASENEKTMYNEERLIELSMVSLELSGIVSLELSGKEKMLPLENHE